MKAGDNFVCCKATQVHTLYKNYEVDKIVYEYRFDIITGKVDDFEKIERIQMLTDNNFLAGFNVEEFKEHFITTKEYRKIKLKKINESPMCKK
jgi:hypothetical protein